MADTVETDYPLNFRDKKALLARKVEVRSFLVEEPTWSSPVDLPSGIRQSVVFANPFKQNVHELAYLEPDGTLVYLERSPDSTTGWSKSVIPGRYTQVVSTIHPDGSVWLFALGTPPGLVQQMHGFLLDEEGWASLYSVGLSGAAQIYAGLGPDGGPRISGSGSVPHNGSAAWELAPVSTGNGWEPKPLQFGAQPNAVDWVAGYDRWGHQKTYSLVPNASGRGMQLVISYEPGTRTVTDDVMSLAGPSVTQVDGLAVLDGVYYLTRGNTLAVGYALAGEVWPIPTPGHVWAQASAHSDDQGQVIFVGLQAGDVRVARQTGSEPSLWQYTVPTFEPFGPTTAGMTFTIATGGGSQLAVDLSPTNRIAIATWGGTKSSRMHTHDLRFGWRDEPLRLPADISLANERLVTHYVADAYVRNGIGAPMQVVPVGLSADIPIQVEVQGQQVVLGPDATVSTFTDVFGKVTFRLPATALDTPLIHLSALGLGQGASVNLAECVQDFLGGDAAIAAVSEGLTAATLNQAQVHGQPLIPFSRAPIQAPAFVSQSHRAFARPGYESPPPPTGSGDPTSSRPQTSGSTHSTDPSQDDLLQSFRCGAVAVNGLSFDADTRAAIVWIPVAEGSFELPLNLDAAEYSARVLECLFRWCSASAADVLGWLTSTIDFAQMWNPSRPWSRCQSPSWTGRTRRRRTSAPRSNRVSSTLPRIS